MGRYYSDLLLAILSMSKNLKFFFITNSNLDDVNIIDFQSVLSKSFTQLDNIEFNKLDLIVNDLNNDVYTYAYKNNTKIITEYFLTKHKKGDRSYWLEGSLLQEPIVPAYPDDDELIKTTIWYDLMPYLMSGHYFPDPDSVFAKSYLKRLNILPEIDHIFSISDASKNDLIEFISIPAERITVINGAPNSLLQKKDFRELSFKLKEPYFLCPASPEPNKNLINTVKAFSIFNKQFHEKYTLVITSVNDKRIIEEANQICENLIFPGHISIEELGYLYTNTEALIFMSKYEGLGLPILEAVKFNKKVICSKIPVFEEIANSNTFYWADPENSIDISDAICRVLSTKNLTEVQKKDYDRIKENFTWENSSDIIFKTLPEINKFKSVKDTIAIVGPHPSSFSAIAKIITESHPLIYEKYNVHYFYDSGPSDDRHGLIKFNYLREYEFLYPIEELFINNTKYKKIICHMGNSDHHMKSYIISKSLPTTLIIHDTDLSGNGLAGQMLSHGYITRERMLLEEKIETEYLKQPVRFITSLVSSQNKIVTHSNFSKDIVDSYNLRDNESPNSLKVNLPISTINIHKNNDSEDTPFKLGIAGILTNVKGVNTVEWLLDRTNNLAGFELFIFGYGFFADKKYLQRICDTYPNINVNYDISDFEFKQLLNSLDLLLNYRPIYKGETSRSTQEALREGVIPILRNIGWYAELPDSISFKLDDLVRNCQYF